MHMTPTREKIKALKADIQQYQKETRLLAKIPKMAPAVRERQAEIDRLKDEIVAIETANKARIEDLHVWEMEKVKGSKTYTYWMASWREGEKVHNVHLGSTKKLSKQEALEKARKMKVEALGIEREARTRSGRWG
jgi:wobble nucleotide-excising tRNase